MTAPHPPTPARARSVRPLVALGFVVALSASACVSGTPGTAPSLTDIRLSSDAKDAPPGGTTVGGVPLFANWPKNAKPDAVIVFTGQTFGFVQPCGCSRPQTGGLERRAVFMDSLRAKGWPVAGVDLGDVYPEKSALKEQGQFKYVASMNALREMGYLAVGAGKTELSNDFMSLLIGYAGQKEQRPFTLAGNVAGQGGGKVIPREELFGFGGKGARPALELIEVGKVGEVPVGVAGVIGKALALEAQKAKWDEILHFTEPKDTLKAATAALANHPLKPQLNVLIYQGTADDAAKVAKDWPQFQVILCQADTDLAPLQPTTAPGTNTLIVQVGHKGQHIGALGVFKKAGGSFDLKYQLVPMGEEYITPGKDDDAKKANKVLPILDEYAKQVKGANLLAKYPRTPHAAQIQAAGFVPPVKLTYVGSETCRKCHAAEAAIWDKTKHGHALDALEKVATRPTQRQYDPECVRCHTVGFDRTSGYQDEIKTPHLKHVGCETCHGPGSEHSVNPRNKNLQPLITPWKQVNAGVFNLPSLDFMQKMAGLSEEERGKVAVAPAEQLLFRRVERTCMECHDGENDPHFDLYKYWPKIAHGPGVKAAAPAAPPKK